MSLSAVVSGSGGRVGRPGGSWVVGAGMARGFEHLGAQAVSAPLVVPGGSLPPAMLRKGVFSVAGPTNVCAGAPRWRRGEPRFLASAREFCLSFGGSFLRETLFLPSARHPGCAFCPPVFVAAVSPVGLCLASGALGRGTGDGLGGTLYIFIYFSFISFFFCDLVSISKCRRCLPGYSFCVAGRSAWSFPDRLWSPLPCHVSPVSPLFFSPLSLNAGGAGLGVR